MQVMKKRSEFSIATCFMLFMFIFILYFGFQDELSRARFKLTRALLYWKLEAVESITCNRSHDRYDLCSINGPTLLEPTTSTLYAMDPTNYTQPPLLLKIHPYPRKGDKRAMSGVKELTLTSAPHNTQCGVTHSSPALVFNARGYTGNFFHDFNDGFVPLFITVNSLFFDQDVILVITDCHDHWPQKYAKILSLFSRHPIINMKKEIATHCFPSTIVGLITHGTMKVDPTLLPYPKSLLDFRDLLENAYTTRAVPSKNKILSPSTPSARPRLVLVSRKGNIGRIILNQKEVIKAAEEVGFDVKIFEPTGDTPLAEAFKIIHQSHIMLGVHGAALTHSLFLKPGAILMEVVPLGADRASRDCFEMPARTLGLNYMKYKIRVEESSLVEKYGANDLVLKDPTAFIKGNWTNMKVYLRTQNVKLDIVGFQRYLREAYKKATRFMAMKI